jgi:hypothetical protein
MKTTHRLGVAVLSLSCIAMGAGAPPAPGARGPTAEFASLRLHLEVDLQGAVGLPSSTALQAVDLLDQPAEVSLEAVTELPLRWLRMVDPHGKTVLRLSCARAGGLGGSELSLETEAESLRELLARYPLGTYQVQGLTMDGQPMAGSVELSGAFPGCFTAGFEGNPRKVPVHAAELTWSPAHAAAGYELEIENEGLGFEFSVRLPATATGFSIPAQLLVPAEGYEYSLNVQGDTDNELEVEGSFATVP